jgi:hypothetical protein
MTRRCGGGSVVPGPPIQASSGGNVCNLLGPSSGSGILPDSSGFALLCFHGMRTLGARFWTHFVAHVWSKRFAIPEILRSRMGLHPL